MVLLLALTAFAQDAEPWERKVSLAVGPGVGFLVGGNGGGYGVGFAQRVRIDGALSPVTSLQLDLDHSRHPLRDASGYFEELAVPADAMEGTRDYVVLDLGAQVDIDPGPAPTPDRFHVNPLVRFGAGVGFTDTKLDAPSFEGRVELRSRAVAPLISLGAGVELTVRRWLTFAPAFQFQGLLARDDGEIDHQTQVGVEMRGQATLDVTLNF